MTEGSQSYLDDIYAQAKCFFEEEGKDAHVVELLEAFLAVRPNHSYGWLMYGDSLRVLGRSKEALPALLKALELAPTEKKGFVCARIGMLCATLGSRIEADDWYKQAIQYEGGTLGWVWIFRGANLTELGEFDKALECYRESLLKEEVDREESYLNIGNVLRAQGKYPEAVEAFRRALELAPDYDEAKSALNGLQDIQKTRQKAAQIKRREIE